MTLEQQVYDALIADAGIQGVIGANLFLVQLPQNPTYPSATYQRVSTSPLYVQATLGVAQASMGWARFRFTCWATGATSGQMVEAFFNALLSVLGTFNAAALPTSPEVINQAPNFVLNHSMLIEPQPSPPIFKSVTDVKIWYQNQ